jgi:hypothetical protein
MQLSPAYCYFLYLSLSLSLRSQNPVLKHIQSTVRSLIKLNATVTSQFPAGTAKKKLADFIILWSDTCIGKTL